MFTLFFVDDCGKLYKMASKMSLNSLRDYINKQSNTMKFTSYVITQQTKDGVKLIERNTFDNVKQRRDYDDFER